MLCAPILNTQYGQSSRLLNFVPSAFSSASREACVLGQRSARLPLIWKEGRTEGRKEGRKDDADRRTTAGRKERERAAACVGTESTPRAEQAWAEVSCRKANPRREVAREQARLHLAQLLALTSGGGNAIEQAASPESQGGRSDLSRRREESESGDRDDGAQTAKLTAAGGASGRRLNCSKGTDKGHKAKRVSESVPTGQPPLSRRHSPRLDCLPPSRPPPARRDSCRCCCL